MLKVNNIRPENITCNSQDVKNVGLYDENNVYHGLWGKKLVLQITQPQNATLTVERNYSPFENAQLKTLTNSDEIYYGDVLKCTLTCNQGYSSDGIVVNSQVPAQSPLYVNCAGSVMRISATTHAQGSWHQIFSGSRKTSSNTSSTAKDYNLVFEGLLANVPTRVTGTLYKETMTVVQSFTNATLPHTVNYGNASQIIKQPTEDDILTVTLKRPTPTVSNKAPFFIITKIEQYY